MTWGYLPPAVSDVYLTTVIARLLRGDAPSLEDEISGFLGSEAVATGSSWVAVLRYLLEELARAHPGRREIVLPSYSCNEFTKATLLAGLEPRYVDLSPDLAADPKTIEAALTAHTLAAFAINNIGRESDNAGIRALCERRSVICIEDATYTFLGRSERDGRWFGTYGHHAVLNFSEGKVIPVGGGAVIANTQAGADVIRRVRARIGERSAASVLGELLALVVYRGGSSRLGYTAYRRLRELTGADLKKRLSMEPTRANEVGHDLTRDERGRVVIPKERADSLVGETDVRPLGRVKQLCGSEVIRHSDQIRRERRQRHETLLSLLRSVTGVESFPFPREGMRIKAPVVMSHDVAPEEQRELDRLGVARGYNTDYPTYGDAAYPASNRFFERLFTLPVHRHITPSVARDIARLLLQREPHRAADPDLGEVR
jgi:dTDP-4-amino-4,6-dideoxygalactose transaminase